MGFKTLKKYISHTASFSLLLNSKSRRLFFNFAGAGVWGGFAAGGCLIRFALKSAFVFGVYFEGDLSF
ncbi:MAG: hypothetical protein CL674_07325 [Bdellovibrionaceae bacterium]|nr:hypothetical protein [Pseudobdellovibrionaceae bacterium]